MASKKKKKLAKKVFVDEVETALVKQKEATKYYFFGTHIKGNTKGSFSLYKEFPFGTSVELIHNTEGKPVYEAFFLFPGYQEATTYSNKSGQEALDKLEIKVRKGFKPLLDMLGVKCV